MSRQPPAHIPPWMLFALPVAIAVPVVAGILLGGPALGFLLAVAVAAVILGVAIRRPPHGARRPPGEGDEKDERQWRAAAARRFLVPLAVAAIGVVLVIATEGTVNAIGWAVLAVSVTVATLLVFLEIGYSEDRARASEPRGTPQDHGS